MFMSTPFLRDPDYAPDKAGADSVAGKAGVFEFFPAKTFI
jgi:hypothetical protein